MTHHAAGRESLALLICATFIATNLRAHKSKYPTYSHILRVHEVAWFVLPPELHLLAYLSDVEIEFGQPHMQRETEREGELN